MHFPTDVLAGALLGIACLWIAMVALRAARSSWEQAQTSDPGSASGLHLGAPSSELGAPAELRA